MLSSKFAFVLAVMTFIAWSITNQMIAFEATTRIGYNAWDVFLGVFGGTASVLPPAVIFPMLFILLLGSSLQEDILSGYSLVVQARLTRKNSYFWIKVLAVLAVIAIAISALYVVSLLMGMVRGFALTPAAVSPAGGHPDAWSVAPAGVPPIYYSLPAGANIVAHSLFAAAYLAFAYSGVVLFVVGLTVRSKNLYVPLAIGALLTTSQLALSAQVTGFLYEFNLMTALIESSHRVIPALSPHRTFVPWSSSVILLSVLLSIGLIAGSILTPTRISGAAARRPLKNPRRIATTVIMSMALLVVGGSLTACSSALPTRLDYEQFYWSEPPPQPAPVELTDLSEADLTYLRAVAQGTGRLSTAWNGVTALLGPENLHVSDESVTGSLQSRLTAMDRELRQIRALEPTPALEEWYHVQFAPGLEELGYVVDNLGRLYIERDHVGVRTCLQRVDSANSYLAAAGETISQFSSK